MPRWTLIVFVLALFLIGCAKTVVEMEPIPFGTDTRPDPKLYDFETEIVSSGAEGTAKVTYKGKENPNGEILDKKEVGREIVSQPQNEVIARGSKSPSGVLLVVRSNNPKKNPWSIDWHYGFSALSGWPTNYDKLSRNSLLYDFASQDMKRPTASDLRKYVGALLTECPGLKPGAPFEESPLLENYPTINFNWKPVGSHKFSFSQGGNVSLAPKIEIPPQISQLWFFLPFDLGNKEGIVLADTATGIAYTCGLSANGQTNILDSRQIFSNVAISPDRKKIAFAYNSGIYIHDVELGSKEIVMNWALNANKVWDFATTMVGFNPDSDLVCFLWPEVTNSFDTPNPPCHFHIGSWRANSSKMIMPEISRSPRDGSPFFWLRD